MDNEDVIEEINMQNDGDAPYQEVIIGFLEDGANESAKDTIDRYINHLQQLKGLIQ